ncbi:MAG: plastocyanin/azurin family copper-binding protein [Thiotrichales bacterium]|nr:plastocyanin/azurin family copper-binding protein [Thiotrichales bacterium]
MYRPVIFLAAVLVSACGEGDKEPVSEGQDVAVVSETRSDEVAADSDPVPVPEQQTASPDTVTAPDADVDTARAESGQMDTTVVARTHTINAQARIFKPEIIYINPGDTVQWINMTSHNTVSVDDLLPEGAKPWQSKLGENLKLKLEIVGIYPYVCVPHIGFGMIGVIVVGKPDNLEDVRAKAMDTLQGPYRRLLGKLKKVSIPG